MSKLFDVEYLLKPLAPDRHVIYRYRTGMLRSQLRRTLEKMSKPAQEYNYAIPIDVFIQADQGMFFADLYTSFVDLSQSETPCAPVVRRGRKTSALIDQQTVREVSAHRLTHELQGTAVVKTTDRRKRFVDDLVSALAAPVSQPSIVFAQTGHALFRHPGWESVSGACDVIDEVTANSETIRAILSYFEATTDLLSGDCSESADLRGSFFDRFFHDRLVERPSVSLREVKHDFDRQVLLRTSIGSNEFADTDMEHDQPEGWPTKLGLSSAIRDILQNPGARSQAEMTRRIGSLVKNGVVGRRLVDALAVATLRLVRATDTANQSSTTYLDSANLLIWICNFLIWGDRITRDAGDEFALRSCVRTEVVYADQMIGDFVSRQASRTTSDPIDGLWSPLTKLWAVRDREAESSYDRLLPEMSKLAERQIFQSEHWVARLASMATPGLTSPELKRTMDVSTFKAHAEPIRFGDLFGNDLIIESLKLRFASNNHATPVILHGADGIGKRTIARVYGRAFLCQNRQPASAIACGTCRSCQELESDIGYFEFDAGRRSAEGVGRQVSAWVGDRTFSERQVFLIRNAEASEAALEAFLAELEDGTRGAAFVLCVTDLAALPATVRSRCVVQRVHKLKNVEAQAMLSAMLEADRCKSFNEHCRELIVAASEGRPKDLVNIVKAIDVAGAQSLLEIVEATDLDWPNWAMSYLILLFEQNPPKLKQLELPRLVDPNVAATRIILVLQAVRCPLSVPESLQFLLSHAWPETLSTLRSHLERRAAALGISDQVLWTLISQLWIHSDSWDDVAFVQAALDTRRHIQGI